MATSPFQKFILFESVCQEGAFEVIQECAQVTWIVLVAENFLHFSFSVYFKMLFSWLLMVIIIAITWSHDILVFGLCLYPWFLGTYLFVLDFVFSIHKLNAGAEN